MIEEFLKNAPSWINELNELTFKGLVGLICVVLIVRELGRFKFKQKLQKIAKKAAGVNGDETISGKKLGNPHTSPDELLDFVVDKIGTLDERQSKNHAELKGEIGEIRGKVDVLLQRPKGP